LLTSSHRIFALQADVLKCPRTNSSKSRWRLR